VRADDNEVCAPRFGLLDNFFLGRADQSSCRHPQLLSLALAEFGYSLLDGGIRPVARKLLDLTIEGG
jgi:hypothetical protein